MLTWFILQAQSHNIDWCMSIDMKVLFEKILASFSLNQLYKFQALCCIWKLLIGMLCNRLDIKSFILEDDEKGSGDTKKYVIIISSNINIIIRQLFWSRASHGSISTLTCRLEIKYLESKNSIYWTNTTLDDARLKRDDENAKNQLTLQCNHRTHTKMHYICYYVKHSIITL